jgi:hypothetical protein
VIDQDGGGNVSAGDIVQVTNDRGEVTRTALTREQAIDFNQRSNVVATALRSQPPPWQFTGNTTPVLKDDRGRPVQSNEFWEFKEMNGTDVNGRPAKVKYLQIREGVDPARAVDDLYKNPKRYEFDCATAVRVVNLKATLDTVGADDFNASHNQLMLYGRWDQRDGGALDGGWTTQRFAQERNGEFGKFDPASGDRLVPGDWRWYEREGDTTTASQGWNVIYLGKDENGKDQFWRTMSGTFTDSQPGEVGGRVFGDGIAGEYLAGIRGTTDINALIAMDQRPGPGR